MAPGRLLLAALAAASVACASADNIAIPWVFYGLLPSNSQQDPNIVTHLPPGMSFLGPDAIGYFVRWCVVVDERRNKLSRNATMHLQGTTCARG